MPAKAPIYLKTATPKRGQKLRLRDVLSSDMISPPLGDFRHSAHIGLDGEGDMFGELSFLQGRYDVLPGLLSRRRGGGLPPAPDPPRPRPLLKTAVSLPAFSGGGAPGPEQAPPKPPRLHHLEEEAPPPGGPGGGGGGGGGRKPLQQQQHPQQQRSMSVSCAEGCFQQAQASSGGLAFSARGGYDPLPFSVSFSSAGLPPPPEGTFAAGPPPLSPELPRSESLLQLDLDLGPSILEDVLRIMEEYQRPQGPKAL